MKKVENFFQIVSVLSFKKGNFYFYFELTFLNFKLKCKTWIRGTFTSRTVLESFLSEAD